MNSQIVLAVEVHGPVSLNKKGARSSSCTRRWSAARSKLGGATPKDTTFVLDAAGNVKTENHSDATGSYSIASSYDADRLTSQTVSQAGSTDATSKFFYDTLGNLQCKTTSAGVASNCTTPEGTASDPALVEAYAYDSDSRLRSFRSFAGGAKTRDSKTTYDPFDRPVEQNEAPQGAAARTTLSKFIGLSDDVGSEERRGTDATSPLQDTKSYSYDASGRRLSMTNKSEATAATPSPQTRDFEYAENAHGDVSMLLDSAGAAQASYGYSAYGQADDSMTQERDADNGSVLNQKAAGTNQLNLYRYSSKRLDPSSGSLDMGARSFAPSTGRFLQEDVYKDALGDLDLATDPLTQNRYSLAGGNPVSFIEADGHEPISSYKDRRSVNSPYGRRAHPRRQQSSQTADSYDRASRPSYQKEVAWVQLVVATLPDL